MATATIETPRTDQPTFRDRAAGAVRQVADLACDAQQLKTVAATRIEAGAHAAKRTLTERLHDLEVLRDSTADRVRKAPFTAVGVALGAGIVVGALVGWFSKSTETATQEP